jgi:hypothetical protein
LKSDDGQPLTRICPHCNGTGRVVEIDDAALVAAIADWTFDNAFNAKELVDYAQTVGVGGSLGTMLAGLSVRRVGKALQRVSGQDFGGLIIERIGSDSHGGIWLVRVHHTHTGSL